MRRFRVSRYHSFMHHQSTMNKSQKNTYQSTQSSSIIKQVYIYSSNATPGPFQLHPMVNDHPCLLAPENPMVPPKLIQQTVGFTSICVL
jgi:hypothetical protein